MKRILLIAGQVILSSGWIFAFILSNNLNKQEQVSKAILEASKLGDHTLLLDCKNLGYTDEYIQQLKVFYNVKNNSSKFRRDYTIALLWDLLSTRKQEPKERDLIHLLNSKEKQSLLNFIEEIENDDLTDTQRKQLVSLKTL